VLHTVAYDDQGRLRPNPNTPVSADSRRRPVSAAVLSFMFASERMLRFTLIRLVRPYLEGAIVEPRTAAECFSKNSQRSANG